MILKRQLIVFGIRFLSAFGLLSAPAFAMESVMLTQRPMLSNAWTYALDHAGNGWFAYYGDDDNILYVRRPDGSEAALGAKERERYQSGVATTATEQDLAVLWRDKLPEKALYFLPSLGSAESVLQPTVVGGQESEPLTRLRIGYYEGTTYFLWLGEKGQWKNPETPGGDQENTEDQRHEPYHLYFRYTEDGGKTFSNVEQVLAGLYPTWIIDKSLIPIFSRTNLDNQLAMVVRTFDRASKKFGPPVKIADASPIEPVLEAFESGGRWFLLWISLDDDPKNALLQGAVSDDKGQSWKQFAFESLRGLAISRLDTATDGQGHILISVSGSWEFLVGDPSKVKDDVYVIRSTDHGATWSEPLQLRTADLRQFHARYPAAVFGTKPGSVMLAWEDWRDIRPNIYIQFSTDYGASWSKAKPLDRLAAVGYGLDFQNKTAWAIGNDRFQVLAKRYLDYKFKASNMIRYEFSATDLLKKVALNTKQPPSADRSGEVHLRERVNQYWEAMKEQDWTTSYAINDPFFRSNVPYDTYQSTRGVVRHLDHEVLEITQPTYNLAKVRLRFTAEVPKITIHGKPFSQPPQSRETTETWLFIDNEWYREYYDQLNNVRFSRY